MEQRELARLHARAEAEATRQYTTEELYEEVCYYGMAETMHVALAETIARLP